ncbi:hypothetical protein ACOI1C_06000 [Bacillus sp. DJP31]|uniref:hypothetical protein n=1 Tax=Bacillus sp. DJP31 TaxID=3409789 RepID=UPI003BB50748
MKGSDNESKNRHVVAYVSPFGTNLIHLRNPWIPAWWSAAFPGLGHMMLCKYAIAFVLVCWEVFINQMSGINTSIYYSMVGDFETAKESINLRWFLLYIPVYVFAIWDSYYRTIKINKDYLLCYRKGYVVISNTISTLELNKLQKRKPVHAGIWSLLAPGFGYLHINRFPSAFLLVSCFVIISYMSNLLPAVHFTMVGDFHSATNAINVQWFLYIPSLYCFTAYDCYVNTVEYNKLFEKEQSRYLKKEYQSYRFKMPE